MKSIRFTFWALLGAVLSASAAPVVLDPGEKLVIRPADHEGMPAIGSYQVWCRRDSMPGAVAAANKAKIFRETHWEFFVLGLLPRVNGRPPAEIPVDLAAKGVTEPGDYRIDVEAPNRWFGLDVRIRRPSLKMKDLAWRMSADGVRWRMTNDADVVLLVAKCAERQPVSVFLDPKGTGVEVHRVTVSPDGTFRDLRAVDDNHNTDTFVPDATWRSRATVRAKSLESGWRFVLRVPVGAFRGVPRGKAADWGVDVSYADRVTRALAYPKVRAAPIPEKLHEIDVVTPKIAALKRDGTLELDIQALLVNGEPNYRRVKARLALETPEGESIDFAESEQSLYPSKSTTLKFKLGRGKVANGQKTRLRWEVFSTEGVLESAQLQDYTVLYEPMKIAWIEPGYHDCVFASMKLEKVVGEVRLEEGIGAPLEIRFEGPDRTDRRTIATAAATNRFAFAIAGRPDGEYFVRIGRVSKRLRKLPPRKDEIWIDADGVIRFAGEKTLPLGWCSDTYRFDAPGINMVEIYDDSIHDAARLTGMLDNAWKHGRRVIVSPIQDMGCGPRSKLFNDAMKRGFGDGEFAGARRRAIEAFARVAGNHPGFFAYYLWDEPEGAGYNPEFFAPIRAILAEIDPYHPTYINNYTIEGTRRFAHCADILGCDSYPVYHRGRRPSASSLLRPLPMIRQLGQLGKSSLWSPQAFDWDYFSPGRMTRGPTYVELREQTYLGFVANVKGIGFYSAVTGRVPGYEIQMGAALLGEEMTAAKDLFLAPNVADFTCTPREKGRQVVAALKTCGGRAMLIAINPEGKPTEVEFRSASLPRRFFVGGSSAALPVRGGVFTDTLNAAETKIYYSYAGGCDFEAARRKVAAAEAGRRKPGNLAVASSFATFKELKDMGAGKFDNGFPKIVASSSAPATSGVYSPYMLQDGLTDEFPAVPFHVWSPDAKDKTPSVTVEFGAKKRVTRVVVTRAVDKRVDGQSPVRAIAVEIGGRDVGTATFVPGRPATVGFPAVETDRVTVRITEFDRAVKGPWLAEVEVY